MRPADLQEDGIIDIDHAQAFVSSYAADLASGDGDRIAANYDVPALMLMSPQSPGTAVGDLGELGSRFSAGAKMYLDHGFGTPLGSLTRFDSVTDDLGIAWVNWDYRSTDGDALYDADYVYVLRDMGHRVSISTVISVNEPERLTAWLQSRPA